MKRSTIITTKSFQLVSYGNGLSYDFINLSKGRSVFFQGDDASDFKDRLDNYLDKDDWSTAAALHSLWIDYGHVSEPIK
jgi:hypothetical protein